MLFLTGLLVGSPVKNNVQVVYLGVDVVGILYLITKALKQQKLITHKMDIFVGLLCFSSCIPMLAGTYTSLNDGIQFMVKYSSIFLIYWMTKHITKDKPNIRKFLIYILLINNVLLVLFGIDRLTNGYTNEFTEKLDTVFLAQDEVRMTSLFSYANSFCAVLGCCVILALGEMVTSPKRLVKAFHQTVIFVLLVGVILSLSRMMYVMLGLVIVIFWLLSKTKENRLQILETMLTSGILAMFYATLFMEWHLSGEYDKIWMTLLGACMIAFVLAILIFQVNQKLWQAKKTTLCILTMISVVLGMLFFQKMLTTPTTFILFDTINAETRVERHLNGIEGNQQYVFEFEVEAKGIEDVPNFQIIALEKDKYWEDVKRTELRFGDAQGIQSMEIHTAEETTDIYLIFLAVETRTTTKLEIKHFTINGKEKYLNYRFLPYDFVSKIEHTNVKTKSVWERGVYIGDAFKIIKDNWLFGIGGDGWHYRYGEVQDYYYVAREVHSYPVQLLLEFGIAGLISYLAILIILAKQGLESVFKNWNVEYFSLLCAVGIILLHSCLDFDLSFFYGLWIVFMGLAMLNGFQKQDFETKSNPIGNWLIKGMLIGVLCLEINFNIKTLCSTLELKYTVNVETSFQERYELYGKWIEKMPYDRDFRLKMINLLESYQDLYPEKEREFTEEILTLAKHILRYEKWHYKFEMQAKLVQCSIDLLDYDSEVEMMQNIENGIELIKTNPVQRQYSLYYYLERIGGIDEIGKALLEKSMIFPEEESHLKELAKEVYQINLDEYENNKNYIETTVEYEFERKEDLKGLERCKQNALKAIKAIKEIEKNEEKI